MGTQGMIRLRRSTGRSSGEQAPEEFGSSLGEGRWTARLLLLRHFLKRVAGTLPLLVIPLRKLLVSDRRPALLDSLGCRSPPLIQPAPTTSSPTAHARAATPTHKPKERPF